jgi:DNA polymerase III delta subunit
VVGTDATMVYDAVHNVVASALGSLDPSLALQDFTAKDVTTSGTESIASQIIEALNTPPFLVDRRVVVVRDAQSLVADEVVPITSWMESPAPGIILVLAVVGTKTNKLVKAAQEVIETNVGTRASDRLAFVEKKMTEYNITLSRDVVQQVTDVVGDDVARIDSVARSLASIYGSAPLTFKHIEPYLGDAGDVAPWDLTGAIDKGDATAAIIAARRMLDSKSRAGLQVVNILQRHFMQFMKLDGANVKSQDEAAEILGMTNPKSAGFALQAANRLGTDRIAMAIHWITEADLALKGAVSYGGKDLNTDMDVTELTVVEVLVARLAKMSQSARRR